MIKLAIIDDHKIFREGLKAIIEGFEDIEVVFEGENGKDFLEKCKIDLDIVIMDLDMPEVNGMQTMEALHSENSDVKVIFLSQNRSPTLVSRLMELGARGYLLKESESTELKNAILSVNENGYYFNDLVSRSILMKLANKEQISPKYNSIDSLSERELEVLKLICEEQTNGEIAESLFLSPKTIENHRSQLMLKIGAKNTAGLVVFAVKNMLINVG